MWGFAGQASLLAALLDVSPGVRDERRQKTNSKIRHIKVQSIRIRAQRGGRYQGGARRQYDAPAEQEGEFLLPIDGLAVEKKFTSELSHCVAEDRACSRSTVAGSDN